MPVAFKPPEIANDNEYMFEEGRINSFDAEWPHDDNGPFSKEKMAKAGFYYNGHSDLVKCFVCLIKLGGWDAEEDDPWEKHKELSSDCLFAKFGKEEANLTVEQWCDVLCNRTINLMDAKFQKLQEALTNT